MSWAGVGSGRLIMRTAETRAALYNIRPPLRAWSLGKALLRARTTVLTAPSRAARGRGYSSQIPYTRAGSGCRRVTRRHPQESFRKHVRYEDDCLLRDSFTDHPPSLH